MHPEIHTTKKFIEALEGGKSFSETTVFECMIALNLSEKYSEGNDITLSWAKYYWKQYQEIGERKLKSIAKNEKQLTATLYEYFGK
jgi:hypothetical protein